jgi:hypothetical protein
MYMQFSSSQTQVHFDSMGHLRTLMKGLSQYILSHVFIMVTYYIHFLAMYFMSVMLIFTAPVIIGSVHYTYSSLHTASNKSVVSKAKADNVQYSMSPCKWSQVLGRVLCSTPRQHACSTIDMSKGAVECKQLFNMKVS